MISSSALELLARIQQADVDRARLDRLGGAERRPLRHLQRRLVLRRARAEVEQGHDLAPALGPQAARHLLVADHDAVVLEGRALRDEPLLDVLQHALDGPLEGIAPAAGAGGFVDQDVAGLHLDEVDLRGQLLAAAVRAYELLA